MTLKVAARNDPAAVEHLLRGLPGWFGIDAATREYVRAAATLESYLAEDDGKVVGALLVRRHFPSAAEIHLMAVDVDRHRQGIGRLLVATVERRLRDDGVRWLQVKTLGPSHPSTDYALTRDFYAAVGFEPLEEFPEFWPGNPMLLLVKSLIV